MISNYFKHNLPILIFLTILVVSGYINTLDNQFVSDDIASIAQNVEKLKSFDYVLSSGTGFVRNFLYWFAFKLAGISPIPYRLFNILFHLGNTYLIYALVNILYKRKVAFFTACLFAVHPLLSEAVSWISGGAYSQAAFFFLASFLTYILSKNNNKKLYLISLGSHILATVTQVTPMILPPVLFLYELIFSNIKRSWIKLIPFFLVTVFSVLLTLMGVSERISILKSTHYQEQGFENPLILTPIAISSYLQLLFFPKDLTLYHSELAFSPLEFILRAGVSLGFLVVFLYGLIKKRIIFFWLSFFLLILLPTLVPSFFRLTWIVAERYVYLPSLGIFVLISLAFKNLTEVKKYRSLLYTLFFIIIIILLWMTIVRNMDWQNEDTLWIATGKTSPSSPNTHNNLGDVYGRRGDLQNSIREFQTAIALKPNYADAYHNLGNAYNQMGKLDLAMENYQKAAELNPNLWQSYQNISALNFMAGDYQKAEEAVKQAIKINPKNLNLGINLGVIYLKLSKIDQAKQIFTQILQIDPNNQQARLGLIEIDKIIP